MKKSIAVILSIILVLAITIPAAAISAINVKSIKLDKSSIALKVGETAVLKVSVEPANTTQNKLIYNTANKYVAAIDASGKITGIGEGTTTITVKSANNSKVFSTCKVVVTQVKKAPVSMLFAKGGTDAIDHDYWVDAIKRYQAANPYVKIELNETPWTDFITKLNVALAAGNAPSLVSEAIRSISSRAEAKQFMPLNDYVNNWDGKADMMPSLLDLGSYRGKLYGLAHYPGPYIYMYRKDYFKEAGLDPEKPPKTWAELLKILPLLTKKNGDTVVRAGFVLPSDDERNLISLMRQNGVKLSDSSGSPSWNVPATVGALKFAMELSKYSILITQAQNDKQSPFITGAAAISQVKPSWIAQMIKDDPTIKDKLGIMDLQNVKSSTWAGCEFFFIPTDSKEKDEAWNFIKFALSKEETWNRYKKSNVPVVRTSLKDDYIKDDPILNTAIISGMENGKGAEKVPWWTVALKDIKNMFGEAIFGKKTPEDALESNYHMFFNSMQ